MEAAKGAARGVTESPGSEENSNSEGPTQEANDAPSVATGEVPVSLDAAKNATNLDEKMREATLKIFEDASKDSFLGHGLKILDNSVESLASGAWQALGTAWKGSVSFAQKLENSAENFAGTMQTGDLTAKATAFAPTLIEGGKVLTARGIEMLEYVGRETMDIIISETGIKLEDDAKQSDLLGSGVENDDIEEDITFDRCFYIYGGPEHLEELEALSSHHALLCNRARAKLSNDQRIAFDGLVKQIREIFTLGNENNVDSPTDKGKRMEMENTSEANEIRALHDSSVRKAAELAMGFTATIGGLAMTEVVQKTCDRLEAMKAEGIHRLSELCALCIAHFVTLGNSLLATKSSEVFDPRNGYYEFEWPDDCVGKAINIRTKARAMAKDIEAVVDSFLTGDIVISLSEFLFMLTS
ncbi:hypothetical protein O6H91_Y005900 [Diphasiastrum complanatum]|nr:hypothetical protein O6H91_Y005900 [Diphasiastrum complanatum]